MQAELSPLVGWESFYVIIGSSSAALTGLMFVVVSLLPSVGSKATGQSLSAFGTPTVVHFCVGLLVSANLSAPWQRLSKAGLLTALIGVVGVLYGTIVMVRARRQTEYQPVLEDWVWHMFLPFAAYLALGLAGLRLAAHPGDSLFVIAAAPALNSFLYPLSSFTTSAERLELPPQPPPGPAAPLSRSPAGAPAAAT